MSKAERETENLSPSETALAELSPHAGDLNRDEILYRAGQAAAAAQAGTHIARRHWGWPAAFSTMTAVAATLLVMLWAEPPPRVVTVEIPRPVGDVTRGDDANADVPLERSGDNGTSNEFEEVPEPARSPGVAWQMRNALRPQLDDAAYLQLRDRVLAFGLDWPTPPTFGDRADGETDSSQNYRQLRRAWMGS